MTVLETKVHRASERNAKIAFWLCLFVVGVLTSAIASDYLHPILALFFGAAIGVVVGGVAYVLVRIWPAIRLLWWWTPEILLASGALWGFVTLSRHTDLWLRLVVIGVVVGVPAAVPAIRSRIVAMAWCLIVRHRLRLCFAQFITANRAGSLPLIFWAVPTLVGERVWVLLRPGLSLTDLQARLDKIAVACWASTVTVERANDSNAAYVRIDVKRRDALVDTIASPLVDAVEPGTPTVQRVPARVPTALDLPDVPAAAAAAEGQPARLRSVPAQNGGRSAAASSTAAANDKGDDVDDWI
ncbi:hypothetical protein OHA72_18285 [Dactylosporangium sp. NBC_01737]|uniref:hypothetical protein n=1 Tax=Dactylosporangium sp. NBC_01737 TaxID=2975959 RepID=UPI002E166AA7|nr:hypothetical protein OHA72_18285 [Dactylosporangium sp. NBC_01737]